MIPDPGAVDDREFRVVQGILAVGLLAAFVFGLPWIVPVATVVTGLGALFGPAGNPLHAGYRALLGRREIGNARPLPPVAESSVRTLDLLATGLLALASLGLGVGISGIGWLVALVEAVVAAIAAFTRYNVATALREQLRRDRE